MLALVMSLVAIVITCYWLYRRWNPISCNGTLPPGSMGFPFLGEYLSFRAKSTSFDLHPFIKNRMERYGPIFRTSMFGTPLIVSTDPELNHYIFQQEGQTTQSWYPSSFNTIFGKENIGSLNGFLHKHLKNMVLSLFGPESLKKMLPEVEDTVLQQLYQWSTHEAVELRDATATMIFNLTAKKLISHDTENCTENLRENFAAFVKGLISFPLPIPGTAFYQCLKGRKRAMKMLRNMLHERRIKPRAHNEDFLDYVLQELSKKGTILTEGIALDLMFVLLFASFETTSLALTLAVKYLTDYPLVLQTLRVEHEAIVRKRGNRDCGLTWNEYKSMTYTFQFINETVRLANIAPIIGRKALKDITFKGYTIPAGWGILVCPPAVHLNPKIYENPLDFDPNRWKGGEINGGSKHFMAFGGGMRFCIGADFSKVQMAVFLHHFVTKYRWDALKGGNILRTPGLEFPDGFHVSLFERKTTEIEPFM